MVIVKKVRIKIIISALIILLTSYNIIKYTHFSEFNVGNQWYLDLEGIDAVSLKNKQIAKREVNVAIIDTGIDYNHEAIRDCLWKNMDEIPDDKIDNDKNGFIDDINGWNFVDMSNDVMTGREKYENDHGTECASIISTGKLQSEMKGVNYGAEVKIMTLKVLGGIEKSGKVDDVIHAIEYAELNGAEICNLSVNFKVNNNKLSKIIKSSKMLFVVSAGNNAVDIDNIPIYLGAYDYPNIITVADVDKNAELHYQSNYGKRNVDIAAPGVNIYCAVVGGYDYDTGTSMATAVVTGVCAMALSTNKVRSICELKNILLESSTKSISLKDKVRCSGVVNLRNVISRVNQNGGKR